MAVLVCGGGISEELVEIVTGLDHLRRNAYACLARLFGAVMRDLTPCGLAAVHRCHALRIDACLVIGMEKDDFPQELTALGIPASHIGIKIALPLTQQRWR